MNLNLLRSKMALKGDFTWADLAELLELSRPALTARLEDRVNWTVPEIRKMVQKYELTEEETCEIFGFKADNEN